MRYCESCEAPIGFAGPADLVRIQRRPCRYCRKPLVRAERGGPEEWLAVTDVKYLFKVTDYRVKRLIRAGELPCKTEGRYRYVAVSECAARWKRFTVALGG